LLLIGANRHTPIAQMGIARALGNAEVAICWLLNFPSRCSRSSAPHMDKLLITHYDGGEEKVGDLLPVLGACCNI